MTGLQTVAAYFFAAGFGVFCLTCYLYLVAASLLESKLERQRWQQSKQRHAIGTTSTAYAGINSFSVQVLELADGDNMPRLSFEGIPNVDGFMTLPKGTYAFEIDTVDPNYQSSGEKQSRAMELKLHVIEGVDYDDGTSTVGMERTLRLWFPHTAQKDKGSACGRRLVDLGTAVGANVTFDKDTHVLDIEDTDQFIGQRFVCDITLKNDPKYNDGKPQEDFGNFKAYQ